MTTTRKPRRKLSYAKHFTLVGLSVPRKSRLTNKEKVLRRHPGAVCFHYQGAWQVENIAYESSPFGRGRTPALAWADAARRLP